MIIRSLRVFRITSSVIWIVNILFTAVIPVLAQTVSPGDDYDVLVVPVGPSVSAPGRDFITPDSLDARGFQVIKVQDYELGTYRLEPDKISIHLKANQAIQLLSQFADGIPTSATSVYFSMTATVKGKPLTQGALALLDANNPENLSVSIAYGDDIPNVSREFSLEYRHSPGKVLALIQAVGPMEGESELILERMRLLDGYRELDVSLGATVVTSVENFGNGIGSVIANINTGSFDVSRLNNRKYPSIQPQSLLLSTQKTDDVVQLMIPLSFLPDVMGGGNYPRRFYGIASIRRVSGELGTFSVALVSGITNSICYENHPVALIPSDDWEEVQCSFQLNEKSSSQMYLIVQLAGGPAEIVVDDVSIQSRRDSMYLWDSRMVKTNGQ